MIVKAVVYKETYKGLRESIDFGIDRFELADLLESKEKEIEKAGINIETGSLPEIKIYTYNS